MTRDDVKWTVLMIVAVIVGLAALSEGMVRTLGLPLAIVPWLPWCRLVAFIAGIVGAKLGNSPLPGKPTDQVSQSTLDKIASSIPIVMIAALLGLAALTMPGCGPKQYHTAVVANTSIAQAIFALQDSEIAAHKAGLITNEKHASYKAEILTLLEAGDDLTLALKDWNPAQPVPANVGGAIANVQKLLTDLQINSPQASALLYTVQTVLSVLRGTGVLPPADSAKGSGAVEPDNRIAVGHAIGPQLFVARRIAIVEQREVLAFLQFDPFAHRRDGRVVRQHLANLVEHALLLPVQAADVLDDGSEIRIRGAVAIVLGFLGGFDVGGAAGVPDQAELLGDQGLRVNAVENDDSRRFALERVDESARDLIEVGETGRLLLHALILLPQVARG